MAIALDSSLGSNSSNGLATLTVTTSAAAAAGSRVVVGMSWFTSSGPASPTCTVGGTSATLDKLFVNGTDQAAIFSLVVAGGLASSSSIVLTDHGSGGTGGLFGAAVSYLGTTGLDTGSSTGTGTTAAAWSTGSASNTVADALYVGVAGADGSMTSESSTPGTGNERFDLFLLAANQGMVMQDLIVSSVAARALTGTWGTTAGLTTQTMALVTYKGTAAAAATTPFVPQRMPLGA